MPRTGVGMEWTVHGVVTAWELPSWTRLTPQWPQLGAQRQALPGSVNGCASVTQPR